MFENLEAKIISGYRKARENPFDLAKYCLSYGSGSVAGYAFGSATSYYMNKYGFNPGAIATTSAIAHTLSFYLTNIGVYTMMHWQNYKQGRPWLKDMENQFSSTIAGSICSATAKGLLHWGLMKTTSLHPVPAFFIGHIIPGALAAIPKIALDVKNNLVIQGKKE